MPDSARPPLADPPAAPEMSAHPLARSEDVVFPPLRLTAIPGEPKLDNILRQIEALMRPSPGAAARLALPPPSAANEPIRARKPPPAMAPTARAQPVAAARRPAGLRAVAAFALIVAVLLPAADVSSLWSSGSDVVAREAIPPPPTMPMPPSVSVAMPPTEPTSSPSSDLAAVSPAAPAAPASQVVAAAALPPQPPNPSSESARAAERDPALATVLVEHGKRLLAAGDIASARQVAAALPPQPPNQATESGRAPERNPGLAAVLSEHGKRLLAAGDIASARQFFTRALALGAARAAGGMGQSYDPLFLRQINAVGVKADPAQALAWYRRAAEEGDGEAALAIERLQGVEGRAAQ